MASLTLSSQHHVVRALFAKGAHGVLFTPAALFVSLLLAFALAVVTYGAAIPSGLFVPCMTIGALGGATQTALSAPRQRSAPLPAPRLPPPARPAALSPRPTRSPAAGRLLGELVNEADPSAADAGFYALVGAAAMLAGVTRMTISLTVIVCEVSNDAASLLPLTAAILAAKLTADLFNDSLYDAAIDLARWPYLPPKPPRGALCACAEDVMAPEPVCLSEVEHAGAISRVLRTTKHSAYAVVTHGGNGRRYLSGCVLRYQLEALLARRAFVLRRNPSPGSKPPPPSASAATSRSSSPVSSRGPRSIRYAQEHPWSTRGAPEEHPWTAGGAAPPPAGEPLPQAVRAAQALREQTAALASAAPSRALQPSPREGEPAGAGVPAAEGDPFLAPSLAGTSRTASPLVPSPTQPSSVAPSPPPSSLPPSPPSSPSLHRCARQQEYAASEVGEASVELGSAEAMRLDRRDERHGAGGVVPATTPLTLVPKPARPRPLGRALSLTPA